MTRSSFIHRQWETIPSGEHEVSRISSEHRFCNVILEDMSKEVTETQPLAHGCGQPAEGDAEINNENTEKLCAFMWRILYIIW